MIKQVTPGMGFATYKAVMLQSSSPSAVTLRPSFAPGADTVMSALRGAADETGADFGYLLNTAMRESSLNPAARASTSSATGLFQFIEQTWLGTMRAHGAEHGFQAYADVIQVGKDGRFTVTEKGLRQEILALRNDPKAASLLPLGRQGRARHAGAEKLLVPVRTGRRPGVHGRRHLRADRTPEGLGRRGPRRLSVIHFVETQPDLSWKALPW